MPLRRGPKAKFKAGELVCFASHVPAKIIIPAGFDRSDMLVIEERVGKRYSVRQTVRAPASASSGKTGWFYEDDLEKV
jgi:hypothetical protein